MTTDIKIPKITWKKNDLSLLKLNIIIADKTIVRVKQDKTKLLDLHGYLPFALHFDPNSPTSWNWSRTPSFWHHELISDTGGWGRIYY